MSTKYFCKLNYTLANEDSWPEINIAKKIQAKKILAIGGSGGRSLPLLSCAPESLHYIDLGLEQLHLIELRKESIRSLNYQQFLTFWGYPPYADNENCKEREDLFASLSLKAASRTYFQEIFQQNNFNSPLYMGKWEKTFATFSKVAQRLLGKKNLEKFLTFKDLEEQRKYLATGFPRLRWKIALMIMGNAAVFNALLYKGNFIKKNIPLTHYQFYKSVFDSLFENTLVKENFFIQLCFFGKIQNAEALPAEADQQIFNQVKEQLVKSTTSMAIQDNIINYCQSTSEKFDFISFSDVPSYFEGELEEQFMQKIKPALLPGALIINRYYLRIPQNIDLTGFSDVTEEFTGDIKNELVGVYQIKIYRNN